MVILCCISTMIRKILFLILLAIAHFGVKLSAQCLPDTTIKSPGYYPNSLPKGLADSFYSQTISVLSVRDTTISIGPAKVKVKVDSIKASGVIGLPNGFNYQCSHPRCVFVWDEVRCVKISGKTSMGGIYPIKIPVLAYGKLGTTPLTQPDTVKNFFIEISGGLSQIFSLNAVEFKIFPNPGAAEIQVISNTIIEPKDVAVYDALGKKQYVEILQNSVGLNMNTKELPNGIYMIKCGNQSQKMMIQHND